jgi:sugar-specific transcriptional regulator TrmB
LLELGKAEVSDIARVAGIKRPTAYFVLKDLEAKGFISSSPSDKIQHFVAESPQKILALEKNKIAELENALPGLLGLGSRSEYKPGTRFFTGKEGVRSVYEESLLQPKGSEMLAIGNAQIVEESIPGFQEWYIKRRVQNNIRMRALTPGTSGSIAVKKRDAAELRQTRLLEPDQFTEPAEINIYGNKVSAVSLIENELVGIIIESKVLAAAQRQLFEILWNHAT